MNSAETTDIEIDETENSEELQRKAMSLRRALQNDVRNDYTRWNDEIKLNLNPNLHASKPVEVPVMPQEENPFIVHYDAELRVEDCLRERMNLVHRYAMVDQKGTQYSLPECWVMYQLANVYIESTRKRYSRTLPVETVNTLMYSPESFGLAPGTLLTRQREWSAEWCINYAGYEIVELQAVQPVIQPTAMIEVPHAPMYIPEPVPEPDKDEPFEVTVIRKIPIKRRRWG